MHRALSLNTLSCGGIGLADAAALTARLGLGGISPTLEDVAPLGSGAAARMIDDAGLRVATLTIAVSASTRGERHCCARPIVRDDRGRRQIGARSVTLTTGGRGLLDWHDAVRFVETIAPCAEPAQAAGVMLAIEPTSHLYADA